MILIRTPVGKAAVIGVALACLGAAWFLLSPLFLTQTVTEASMAGSAVLLQGPFKDGETFHKGEGVAQVLRLPDGAYLLRLENFSVTNGPDLRVLITDTPAPRDKTDLGGYREVAKLKGNMGDQNYPLPSDFDLTAARSVVIFCWPFQVVFSTAALTAP